MKPNSNIKEKDTASEPESKADVSVVIIKPGMMYKGGSPSPGGVLVVSPTTAKSWVETGYAKLK
jgi:hypothetical protein